MVLRILKVIATSGILTALECTKFVFGRGSAPCHTGGASSAPPDPLAGLRGPTSKAEWKVRKRQRERKRAEERNGRDRPPFRKFLDPPLRNLKLLDVILAVKSTWHSLHSVTVPTQLN